MKTPCNQMEERKFIVSRSKLLELFNTCKRCHSRATASVHQTVGTMVRVGAECEFCGFSWHWTSQPSLGNIPSGNLAMSASTLFFGALSAKVLRVLQCMGGAIITKRTFFSHQATIFFLPLFGYGADTKRCMSGRQWTEGNPWLLVEMDERIHLVTLPSLAHTAPLILKKE